MVRRLHMSAFGRIGALSALAFIAVFSQEGCLWAPDIQEQPDIESGPVIDRTLVVPSPDREVELTSLITEFSVAGAIADPDTAIENLHYHWYLGYQEFATPRPPDYVSRETISLSSCGFPDVLEPTGSKHNLELIVSDQPIQFDREAGRLIEGSYSIITWTVILRWNCN